MKDGHDTQPSDLCTTLTHLPHHKLFNNRNRFNAPYHVKQRSCLYTDIYKISHISISSHHQSTLNSLLSSHTLSTTYLSTMCTTNIRVYNCGKYTQSTSHCRKAVWNPITKRMNACGDPRQTVSSTTGTYCNSSKCTQQPGFYRSPSHK